MAKIKSVIAMAKGREMNLSQRHMRELLGMIETSFLYLYHGSSYVSVCQNLWNCILKRDNLTEYKFTSVNLTWKK